MALLFPHVSSCSHSNSHKWFCRLGRKDEHASAPNIYLGCRLIEGREPAEWMFTAIHRITSMFTKGAKLSEKPEPSERQNHVFIISSFARSDLHHCLMNLLMAVPCGEPSIHWAASYHSFFCGLWVSFPHTCLSCLLRLQIICGPSAVTNSLPKFCW